MISKTQKLKCTFGYHKWYYPESADGMLNWPRCRHCGTPAILNVDGTVSGEWEPVDHVVRKILMKLVKTKKRVR